MAENCCRSFTGLPGKGKQLGTFLTGSVRDWQKQSYRVSPTRNSNLLYHLLSGWLWATWITLHKLSSVKIGVLMLTLDSYRDWNQKRKPVTQCLVCFQQICFSFSLLPFLPPGFTFFFPSSPSSFLPPEGAHWSLKLAVDTCLVYQKPALEVKFRMPPGYGDHIFRLKVKSHG